MTDAQAQEFAAAWIESFSAKDVEAVLSHFAENAEFTSPRALAIVGRATLRSRRELADYWHAALKSIGSIRFTLDHFINDERAGRLTIVYLSEVDGKKVRAAEFFQFNRSLQVVRCEAMYGAPVA
jgi:SnoaL-like domain